MPKELLIDKNLEERAEIETNGLTFVIKDGKSIICYCVMKKINCFDIYKYQCPNYRELSK